MCSNQLSYQGIFSILFIKIGAQRYTLFRKSKYI
jgi:hypothetical protein